jgi:hypothetical protein
VSNPAGDAGAGEPVNEDRTPPTVHDPSRTVGTGQKPDDVTAEEWGYWSAQAWAGCGVIVALMLAMFLPLILMPLLGDYQGRVVGFGVAGTVALVSIAVISRLTYRKRQERRETIRLVLAERRRATDDAGERGSQ